MTARQGDGPVAIVIAGGGTGGHLFPGIAVAEELRRRHPHWQLHFVGTARGIEAKQVPRYRFPLHLLPVQAVRGRSRSQQLGALAALPRAGVAALALMARLRPQVAIGVGGYAAGPALVAARAVGARCLVMEQNAHAGATNRLLAKLAHQILLALPNPQLAGPKARVLGNPVRADVVARGAGPSFSPPAQFCAARPLRLFAFGGSQGARAINDALLHLVAHARARRWPLLLLHQTGPACLGRIRQGYADLQAGWAQAQPFIDDMATALAEAHLLVCRAGAGTLAELAVIGRPSILVPYPHAADDHQSANAGVFSAAGAGVVVPQGPLTNAQLTAHVATLLAAPNKLRSMADAALGLGRPQATAAIADIVEQEVDRVSQ